MGEKVLAILLLPKQPLQARFCGPYVVTKKLGMSSISSICMIDVELSISHISMLKKYWEKDNVASVATITAIHPMEDMEVNDSVLGNDAAVGSCKLHNFDILANLD